MFNPARDVGSAFLDYPFRDPEFSLSGSSLFAESGGTLVFGDLSIAAQPGPKGTVIITPPMPGGDDLEESLIIPLWYAGISVLTFYPRGTSGEGEPYSMPKTVDDVHAMVNWIVANSGADKKDVFGITYRLDPDRVALCGLGDGGGNVSIAACAESKIANFLIALAPGNVDAQLTAGTLARSRARFRAIKEATAGEVDLEAWYGALTEAEKNQLSVRHQAPRLVDKHLLMVGAKYDVVSPISICHEPNVKALRNAGAKDLTDVILDTDHMFLTKRYSLARLIITWLREHGF